MLAMAGIGACCSTPWIAIAIIAVIGGTWWRISLRGQPNNGEDRFASGMIITIGVGMIAAFLLVHYL